MSTSHTNTHFLTNLLAEENSSEYKFSLKPIDSAVSSKLKVSMGFNPIELGE
jgi:hypothetical protein